MSANPMSQSNADTEVTVTSADLPLHCPMPGGPLWNSHPKVFISVEEGGEAKCPYCGTVYKLEDKKSSN